MDAFFPFLAEIEKEVMDIERLVYIGDEVHDSPATISYSEYSSSASSTLKPESGVISQISVEGQEKKRNSMGSFSTDGSVRAHFAPQRLTVRLMLRRVRRYIAAQWDKSWTRALETRVSPRTMTLRRIAKTRKLVTLLGRLLTSKADVVAQIRKRLLQSGGPALANGGTKDEELEVAIYMGDVQGRSRCIGSQRP